MPTPQTEQFDEKNKKTSRFLIGIIIGSFILAFASIPLYRIICKSIDPGGSAWQNGSVDDYGTTEVDESRTLRVRFATNVERQLPWTFQAKANTIEVHPGEKKTAMFWTKNLDGAGEITGKAVYDINPPEAGQYFKKIECFCFTEQKLAAGDSMDMPLIFWFEPDIPDHITDITLAYTFFNANTSLKRSREKRAEAPSAQ